MNLTEWYYIFLKNLCNLDGNYDKLFSALHTTEYRYLLELDENRIADGLAMRRIFWNIETQCGENGLHWSEVLRELRESIGRCTCLEMICGLAWRMDRDIMYNPDTGERVDIWIKAMLDNLGLYPYYNDKYFNKREVEIILDTWLENDVDYDGNGGLFIVKYPDRNMATVDTWKRMTRWLSENYEEEFR